MNEDLIIFIFSHGRPEKIHTIKTLKKNGYTGKYFIIIDDEDQTAHKYYELFGDKVIMFNKSEAAKLFDAGDNFTDRRAIVYARNASYNIAKKLGYKYFLQFEDDYIDFYFKINAKGEYAQKKINNLDFILNCLLNYYKTIPAKCIAMQQSGDFFGGKKSGNITNENRARNIMRKTMNSLFCSVDRPVKWIGRLNDDVNTYVEAGRRGDIFLNTSMLALQQPVTQKVAGGHSEIYKSMGTFVKSFYSIMYAPSCVSIAMLNSSHSRLHHQVSYNHAVPCIIQQKWKK